jgi:acetate kinase
VLLRRDLLGLRMVTCHLGAGASLAAVVDGRSVDTTMGLTPLEGLMIATRYGTIDPGLLLCLEEQEHLSSHDVARALAHRSGLFVLAGTADVREVQTRAADGDLQAQAALDVYPHRLESGIGAMAAAGGLDALVFTGGVCEHAPDLRQRAADRLSHLGVAIDPSANITTTADADISAAAAAVHTFVITAREDLQIARETRTVITALRQ